MSSYKFIPRDGSILMYQKDGDVKYTASCQMVLMGERAYIHTLNGTDFYRILTELELAPFRDQGIRLVHAMVSGEHFRAIRIALRHIAKVTDAAPASLAGHQLRWIQIEDLNPPKEPTMPTSKVEDTEAVDSQWRALVETRLKDGQDKMSSLEAELRLNTDATKSTSTMVAQIRADVGEIVEFFGNLKGLAKGVDLLGRIARPLGYIATFVAAVIGAVAAFKAGGMR